MKKTISLVLVLVLGLASVSLAAEHTWRQKADMPTPRQTHSSAVVNGKIYIIGGASSEPDPVAVWPVEVYDPIADSWAQGAHIPAGRAALATAVVNGKIYAIGGIESSLVALSTVLEYDPATDTWTRNADLPEPRCDHAASVVDGKIYAIGGSSSWTNSVGLSTVEVYDPVTDTWTRKANMPFRVWGLCTAVVDGKIYALGGRPVGLARPYVQEYDPATDTWTRKADMPVGTSNMASAVLGNKIFVIGGWLSSGNYPYTGVQMYDPETDIWTIESDAPFLRASFSASVVNNRIYVIGGTDRTHPCPATSTVYELIVGFPDFNGDFKIDIEDLIILIEHWGQDEPSVDIAPPPYGDGIVDVQDLEVLMSYWQQEVFPLSLLAYWKLDETEGSYAADSDGEHDGTLYGEPVWQPTAGAVDGALEFDGTDDYISTPFVLNPADGAFSVFAWIKGGAPGQVILSQESGVNWLAADAVDGALKTDLRTPASRIPTPAGPPLICPTVVTDGDWHRVGFVRDGSYRILYVDDIEVARDTATNLEYASGGLYIGAGSDLEPGALWSGLIDDVRIYNRAVTP